MNRQLDTIFDKALSELKKGASVEEAVLKCQPEQAGLADSLWLAHQLSRLPKKSAPAPAMQRKYALVPAKETWYAWLRVPSLATGSMSLLLFLSAAFGTGYAAYHSMPGQALFAVKKTAENLQLQFATSSEKKVSLQVEFSKKRLMEAEKILKDPGSSPKNAEAAVKELSQQSKNTLENLTTAAKSDLDIQKAKTLVKTMQGIADGQEKLAQEVRNDKSEEIAADVEASAKVINNYVEIAASELEKFEAKTETALENEGKDATSTPEKLSETLKTEKPTTSTSTLKTLAAPKPAEELPLPDPNLVTGGYFPENPEPQYIPYAEPAAQ